MGISYGSKISIVEFVKLFCLYYYTKLYFGDEKMKITKTSFKFMATNNYSVDHLPCGSISGQFIGGYGCKLVYLYSNAYL